MNKNESKRLSRASLKLKGDVTKAASKMIKDLEAIYKAAFEAGNYSAALKAKELQLKQQTSISNGLPVLDQLAQYSDEEMLVFLNELEKKITLSSQEL